MPALAGLSIPLEDLGLDSESIAKLVATLPKDSFFQGKKTYLKLTVSVNDRLDKFNNNVSVWLEQSQEDSKAKKDKKFVGNGKVFWSKGDCPTAKSIASSDGEDAEVPF